MLCPVASGGCSEGQRDKKVLRPQARESCTFRPFSGIIALFCIRQYYDPSLIRHNQCIQVISHLCWGLILELLEFMKLWARENACDGS